ncbi:MAG: hypothetical protein JWR34_5468 [Mycobacterium sp.]|nr:hypothetical protein [Mycobacterium sp.]
MTAFGDEPQNLDGDDVPPQGEPEAGPYRAWSSNTSSNPYHHGMQAVQLKKVGNTHKAACMKFYGSDPVTPTHATLEITQHRKQFGSFDFEGKPEIKFCLEDDEIQVLKAFLAGQFLPADGYYVRVDSKEMAQEVAKYSTENLGEVLAAISDKTHLVEAIQASGHADFLVDYVTNEKKRVELGHLETAVWDPDADEGVFQQILERNPWIFGGEYVAARPERMMILGDQFDVPLVTADGSLHLVELKKARVSPLIRKVRNHLMVSGRVHEAVSQTANYLRALDEQRHRIATDFGIDPRRVHATVVIGHVDHASDDMPPKDVYETIRTYNSHLSRITVMTYDQLLTNARNSLDMLGAVPVAEQDDDTDFGDDDQQDDEDDYGDRESGEDDPWAGYPGPGPDEVEAEPPF